MSNKPAAELEVGDRICWAPSSTNEAIVAEVDMQEDLVETLVRYDGTEEWLSWKPETRVWL